jgi:hypothetical protein
MNPLSLIRRVLPLLACLLVIGCSDKPRLVPLTGRVTLKGQPVTAGSVVLHPDAANHYQKDLPSSLLQLDGSFAFKTFPFGEGVPPGTYTMTLAPELANRLKVPRYARAESSDWKIEVPPSGREGLLFEVK